MATRAGTMLLPLAVVALLAACTAGELDDAEPQARELVGWVTVTGTAVLLSADDTEADLLIDSPSPFAATCEGSGRYVDYRDGTPVAIRDAVGGAVIAEGEFDDGTWIHVEELPEPRGRGDCMWRFSVPEVPVDSATYVVEVPVGGPFSFTSDDLSDANWSVQIRLPSG